MCIRSGVYIRPKSTTRQLSSAEKIPTTRSKSTLSWSYMQNRSSVFRLVDNNSFVDDSCLSFSHYHIAMLLVEG